MVIYVDVLILENFIVNSFLLLITGQTLGIKVRMRRVCIIALLASFYTLCLFFKPVYFLTAMPFKIIVAILTTFLAFNRKDVLFVVKSTAIYICYTFVLAGIIFFIQSKNGAVNFNGYVQLNATAKSQMLILMVSYILLARVFEIIIDRFRLKSFTYNIEIITKQSNLKLRALLDTGNELREPVSNLPVIIVEREKLSESDYEQYDKLYVPYKVVNGQSNILEAFKPEFVKIYKSDKVCEDRKAIIAICDNMLSDHSEYSALLSRGII